MNKNNFLTKLQEDARKLLLPFKVNKKYKIDRNKKVPSINEIKIPIEIKKQYDGINNKILYKKEIGPILVDFIETIKSKIPEENLIIFINNINTLNLLYKDFTLSQVFLNSTTNGQYDLKTNTIELSKNNYKLTIIHELFHMASSIVDKDNNLICSGFFQLTPNMQIGEGLNEGYTQYLAEKYFSDKHTLLNAYSYEKTIAGSLEKIIGVQNMEKFYFTANLKGLIDYLEQYIDKSEINNFIICLDYINNKKDNFTLSEEEYTSITKAFQTCNKFLARLFISKFIQDNETVENEEILIYSLTNFLNSLPAHLSSKKYKFDLSDYKYMEEDIMSFFEHYKSVIKIY